MTAAMPLSVLCSSLAGAAKLVHQQRVVVFHRVRLFTGSREDNSNWWPFCTLLMTHIGLLSYRFYFFRWRQQKQPVTDLKQYSFKGLHRLGSTSWDQFEEARAGQGNNCFSGRCRRCLYVCRLACHYRLLQLQTVSVSVGDRRQRCRVAWVIRRPSLSY